jgi:hypothetical protein
MLNGFIVVREESHIEPKYWVCLTLEDAMEIARAVTDYWINQYSPYSPYTTFIDTKCYENQLFNYNAEELFRVFVQPQQIREPGETSK